MLRPSCQKLKNFVQSAALLAWHDSHMILVVLVVFGVVPVSHMASVLLADSLASWSRAGPQPYIISHGYELVQHDASVLGRVDVGV